MTIRTLAEAEAALQPYVPLVARLTGHQTTLDRIIPLMKLLGNPEERLRVVHLAGTSGKTSTAYYMAALLTASGAKVGLTVSPHVDKLTERVQINGRPLDEKIFCSLLGEFLDIVARANHAPSYFELLYAFALWVFDKQGVDYAVIETGMGGLHDATNVVRRADKLCLLTDIGLDHTHILGDTLAKIAAQKVGIVHRGNHVLTYKQPAEVMQVYQTWITSQAATLTLVNTEHVKYYQTADSMPLYQQRNWQLAYQAYIYLMARDGLKSLTSQALQQTMNLQIPARMEVKQIDGKTIIMDGAHNAQKMTAFIQSFQLQYPNTKVDVLIALKQGKEYQQVAPLLAQIADSVIVTTFDTSQDLPAVSTDPQLMAAAFRAAGCQNVTVIADHHRAYQTLMAIEKPRAIITGSFYLLSQIRNTEGLT